MSSCYWYCQEHHSKRKDREESKQGKAAWQRGKMHWQGPTFSIPCKRQWNRSDDGNKSPDHEISLCWGRSEVILQHYYCHIMYFLLLSGGTQVSAAFTPELVSPVGAALSCVNTSAHVSKHPKVGEFRRVWVFSSLCFLSASVGCRTMLLHFPNTQCVIFSFMPAVLTCCIKIFIRKATCVEQPAQQNTQCFCSAGPLVFCLQVQLWKSSARNHAGDFVPEGKEASSKCQQGHL